MKKKSNARFYLQDGTRCVTARTKSGNDTAYTLKHARRDNAFPSVTTILSATVKYGLDFWKRSALVEALLKAQRNDKETEQDFLDRLIRNMDVQRNVASEFGRDVHRVLEARASHPWMDHNARKEILWIVSAYDEWFAKNSDGPAMATEMTVVGDGYGGTLDQLLPIRSLGPVIVDIKTHRTENGKFRFYPEEPMQLAAYAACVRLETGSCPRIMNLSFSSNEPGVFKARLYTEAEQVKYFDAFTAAKVLWMTLNNYAPRKHPRDNAV